MAEMLMVFIIITGATVFTRRIDFRRSFAVILVYLTVELSPLP